MLNRLRFDTRGVLLLLLLTGALVACGTAGEDTDTDIGASDVTGDDTTQADTGPPPLPYDFVRIDDLSEEDQTPDGGADIDAIVLAKSDGSEAYAEAIEFYAHGGGAVTGDEVDPLEVIGAPDSFFAYPELAECDVDSGTFVSLGGLGGQLIVRMSAPVENGDTLNVLEVGGCAFDGGEAIVEPVDVFVSVGSDPLGQWVSLGQGQGPLATFDITDLPAVYPE